MKLYCKILLITFITFTTVNSCNSQPVKDREIHQLWLDCRLENIIPYKIFSSAIMGSRQINNLKKKNLITIIDYSKPSTENRFFVIDLIKKQLLYKCLVAHGKNSGDYSATQFSNQPESLKSSLGFFITAETYVGIHGFALKLDGLEKGINDNAREREIVIHGAFYVSREFIKKYGRLGRSWGCPALPLAFSKEIINMISGGSCLFIYAVDDYYKKNSKFI